MSSDDENDHAATTTAVPDDDFTTDVGSLLLLDHRPFDATTFARCALARRHCVRALVCPHGQDWHLRVNRAIAARCDYVPNQPALLAVGGLGALCCRVPARASHGATSLTHLLLLPVLLVAG